MLTELSGEILNPADLSEYINIANTFPVVMHKYGQVLPGLNEVHWMRYIIQGNDNFISFFRNAHLHPVLHTMQIDVVTKLEALFNGLCINPLKIQFIKTCGFVPPHVDEDNRNCTINIGIANSASAITKYSTIYTQTGTVYFHNMASYTRQDGHGVLLNTNSMHSVVGSIGRERILITCGFSEQYEDIKSKLKS